MDYIGLWINIFKKLSYLSVIVIQTISSKHDREAISIGNHMISSAIWNK